MKEDNTRPLIDRFYRGAIVFLDGNEYVLGESTFKIFQEMMDEGASKEKLLEVISQNIRS